MPRAVFENPALVVERFVPQREAGLYCLQMYSFLGDRQLTTRLSSRSPVVKSHVSVSNVEVSEPPGMAELRRRMGLDYGKLDHVLIEGRPIVLDLNLTPAVAVQADITALLGERLAPGIEAFLP